MEEANLAEVLAAVAAQHGALLEVCVFGTDMTDWVAVVDWLSNTNRISHFKVDEHEAPPVVSGEIFSRSGDVFANMRVTVGSHEWWTSFLEESEIDFQGDPLYIGTVSELEETIDFMRGLAKVVGKRVVLIPEAIQRRSVRPYLAVTRLGALELEAC